MLLSYKSVLVRMITSITEHFSFMKRTHGPNICNHILKQSLSNKSHFCLRRPQNVTGTHWLIPMDDKWWIFNQNGWDIVKIIGDYSHGVVRITLLPSEFVKRMWLGWYEMEDTINNSDRAIHVAKYYLGSDLLDFDGNISNNIF